MRSLDYARDDELKNHPGIGWLWEKVWLFVGVYLVLGVSSKVAGDEAEDEVDEIFDLKDGPKEVKEGLLEAGEGKYGHDQDKY